MKILVKGQRQTACRDLLKDRGCHSGGYSLISLSLFIVVLGIFTVGGILLAKQFGWAQKQDAGFTTVAQVEEALKNYRALNGNLPCPARVDLGPDDAGFGVANCGAVTTAAGSRNIPGVPTSGEQIKIGSVPIRSLNLPDSAMVDGWGHRLVYAVTEYYTSGSPDFDADRGTIKIIDAEGEDMTPNAQSSVIYAVLTPGAEGRGARTLAGVEVQACPGGGDTAENCDGDAVFVSSILKQFTAGNGSYTANVKYAAVEKAYHWDAPDWKDCKCGGSTAAAGSGAAVTGNASLLAAIERAHAAAENKDAEDNSASGENNNPKQKRKSPGVQCKDMSGNVVADSNCLASTKPKESQSCAAFCWKTVTPACTSCGTSVTDIVTCERKYKNDVDQVADNNCTKFEGYTKSAEAHPCPACPPPSGGGGSDNDGFFKITYSDNGDGTHSMTYTNYNSDGSVKDSNTTGNSGPNSNFMFSSGWSMP